MRVIAMVAAMLIAGGLAASAHASEREVTLPGPAAALSGTLLTPDHARPGPAVLLISGSGPTDRDGDTPQFGSRPGTMRMLAQALAAEGIASLRFDKRLIGKSAQPGVSESSLTFTDYVADAVAWATLLKAEPGVTCVVLVGHSEGALIAALAAPHVSACGVVSLAGVGRRPEALLADQLRAGVPAALQPRALDALHRIAAGELVTDFPPELNAIFRVSVQTYLFSWLKQDPAAAIRAAPCPVLIVQGDHDLQVAVADADALHAARPDATLLIAPGVNHVLKDAPIERAANLATYGNALLPLDAAIAPAVIAFVRGLHASH